MNKENFLSQLKQKLTALSTEEREAALTYYEEYFNDAGIENEQSVINELGSVEKVANGILKENNYQILDINATDAKYNDKKIENNSNVNINYGIIAVLIILYAILAPIILPFIIAIFGVIFGFTCAGIGIVIGGVAVCITAIITLFIKPIDGMLLFGLGLLLLAFGTLITAFMVNICKVGIPTLFRTIVKLFKYPFQKGGINL